MKDFFFIKKKQKFSKFLEKTLIKKFAGLD